MNLKVTPYKFLLPVFLKNLKKRKEKYSNMNYDLSDYSFKNPDNHDFLKPLNEYGFFNLKSELDINILKKLYNQFDKSINQGFDLNMPRDLSKLKKTDFEKGFTQDVPRLPLDVLKDGSDSYRNIVDNI